MTTTEVQPATRPAGVRAVFPTGRTGPGPVPCPEARAGDRVAVLQGGAFGGRALLPGADLAGVFVPVVSADGQLVQRSGLDLSGFAFVVQLTPAE